MAKEICISSTPHETRLAILEDDQLAEIYYERENEYTLAGSIYNGRVTRVLPGMQSAFVDLGLERDAFLYVTDFVELEDQEDTDEIEKAAVTGASQPPREVRHANGQDQAPRTGDRNARTGQKTDRGADSRPDRADDSRQDRPRRDQRPQDELTSAPAGAGSGAADAPVIPEFESAGQEASDAQGGRRWRGRRHRRGGRGPGNAFETREAQNLPAQPAEFAPEPPPDREMAAEIHAAEAPGPAPVPRTSQAPVPFVLPGESLSKYGGAPGGDTPRSVPLSAPPTRASGGSKPSTLIEAPLAWDGSGLLPGESLSRHRERQPEPASEISPEPGPETGPESHASGAEEPAAAAGHDEFLHEEYAKPVEESAPPALHEIENAPREHAHDFDEDQHSRETIGFRSEEEPAVDDEMEEEEFLPAPTDEPAIAASAEGEADENASASHRIDPAAPTGFRLFGLGAKKKKEEAPAPEAPLAASAPVASAYAPGEGLIEEEVIEGEEFEAVPHHRRTKSDEHDLDDYEEETLPTQIRSGDLGEMLQEAHLDHRIQLNLEEQNGEEEDFDGEEEGEEEPSAEAQPALPASRAATATGRGRRGRGAPPGSRQPPRPVAPLRADHRSAHHLRPAQARPGDPGPDRQGAHRQEGRAHHQPHRASRPFPGLHAHRHARGRKP